MHLMQGLIIIGMYRYIGRRISEIDQRLLQITMPSIVTRSPRSIKERAFWKGL